MAINYPGPYEVRLFYSANVVGSVTLVHTARYNCRLLGTPGVGDAFSTISVLRRDDSDFILSDEVDDWVNLIKPLWNNSGSSTIDYAELWKYTAGTFDASYISTYPIAVTPTGANPNSQASENIITFRTEEGGIMKIVFLDTVVGQGYKDTLPFTNATLDAIADAVVAGTVPWMARDTSYPVSCIGLYPGVNEALFKRRYR